MLKPIKDGRLIELKLTNCIARVYLVSWPINYLNKTITNTKSFRCNFVEWKY